MSDSTEPLVQTCESCGTLIDVTEEEPFALMHCPNCGTGMRIRRSFDHFELQEVLGSGGMGAVYRALDTNLNRQVALKLLRREYNADAEFVQRFQTEASITASVNHPHVVKVYSSGEDHGLLYIAMELVDKGSLDDLMSLQGRVAEMQVLEVGAQIARGLQAALGRGLIHRDIKPGNILFADAHTSKIVDFGLAVLMEEAGLVAGEVWGTPYYVAPEKLDNQPEDFRSDMYSLGATLFHAVAGRPPFEAETASMVALKHVKSQLVSLQAFAPDVSSATAYVINRTLNKDPDQRYQSYDELIEHLDYARAELAGKGGATREKSRVVLEGEQEQKAMGWITIGMIALVVLSGVLVFFFRQTKKEPPPDPAIAETQKLTAALDPRYQEARKLLIDAKFSESAQAFRTMGEEPNIPQPMLNWVTVHEGLAELLEGRGPEARTAFAKIEKRGTYSTDPGEAKLAEFFMAIAGLMTTTDPSPASVTQKFEKTNYQAIALLLLALKDWSLEKFEAAGPLFRQFDSATRRAVDPREASPPAPYHWIADYKPLAAGYIEDFTKSRAALADLEKATTDDERKAAAVAARNARSELKMKSKLADRLEEKATAIDQEITAREQEMAARAQEEMQKVNAEEAVNTAALAEGRKKVAPLLAQLRFVEAQRIAAGINVTSEKAKRERDALAKKTEWLARFKATLANDLTTAGYPQPIARKPGIVVPGGVAKANDQQIEVRSQYGFVPVPWTDVMPESAILMAKYFIRPGLTPDLTADRKWLLGVYSFYARKASEGRTLLVEASQMKAEYGEALPLFLEFAETP